MNCVNDSSYKQYKENKRIFQSWRVKNQFKKHSLKRLMHKFQQTVE